jgi:hypothetical protein
MELDIIHKWLDKDAAPAAVAVFDRCFGGNSLRTSRENLP